MRGSLHAASNDTWRRYLSRKVWILTKARGFQSILRPSDTYSFQHLSGQATKKYQTGLYPIQLLNTFVSTDAQTNLIATNLYDFLSHRDVASAIEIKFLLKKYLRSILCCQMFGKLRGSIFTVGRSIQFQLFSNTGKIIFGILINTYIWKVKRLTMPSCLMFMAHLPSV